MPGLAASLDRAGYAGVRLSDAACQQWPGRARAVDRRRAMVDHRSPKVYRPTNIATVGGENLVMLLLVRLGLMGSLGCRLFGLQSGVCYSLRTTN